MNPSPNIRNLSQAILYPGIGLVEFTKLSVGRGTDTPFEIIGAPYINSQQLAVELNNQQLPGVKFIPTTFTPNSSVFANEKCMGIKIVLTQKGNYKPLDTVLIIARTLLKLHPKKFDPKQKLNTLLLHPPTLKALTDQQPLPDIRELWQPELQEFIKRRKRYLLYP